MLDVEEKISAIAATMAGYSRRLPLQRAFEQAFDDVVALREIGVPWAQLAATLTAAGVRTTRGGLISDRRLADLFSRAQSKRRAAPRPPAIVQIVAAGEGAMPLPQTPSHTSERDEVEKPARRKITIVPDSDAQEAEGPTQSIETLIKTVRKEGEA